MEDRDINPMLVYKRYSHTSRNPLHSLYTLNYQGPQRAFVYVGYNDCIIIKTEKMLHY